MSHLLTILTVLLLVIISGSICAILSVPNEFAVLASMSIVVFSYEALHGWWSEVLRKK